jgi:hypothetical protein
MSTSKIHFLGFFSTAPAPKLLMVLQKLGSLPLIFGYNIRNVVIG